MQTQAPGHAKALQMDTGQMSTEFHRFSQLSLGSKFHFCSQRFLKAHFQFQCSKFTMTLKLGRRVLPAAPAAHAYHSQGVHTPAVLRGWRVSNPSAGHIYSPISFCKHLAPYRCLYWLNSVPSNSCPPGTSECDFT